MIFVYAVYNVIIYSSGMTYSQIGVLLSLWAVFAFLLEVPTGYIGDILSRKTILVVSPLIKSITFILWMYADSNFYMFLTGFFFWALASSLKSGTHQAYIYDYLITVKNTSSYKEIVSTLIKYKQIVIGFAMIFGGILYSDSASKVFVFSILSLFLSSFFFLLLPKQVKSDSKLEPSFKESIVINVKNKEFIYIILIVLIITVTGSTEEFDQLYFNELGIPSILLGVFAFGSSLFTSFGAHVSESRTYKPNYLLPIYSLLLILIGFIFNLGGIIFMYLMYVLWGYLQVYSETRIQENIKGKYRATITSVIRLVENLFGSIIIFIFSRFSDQIGVNTIYIFAGILVVLLMICSLIFSKKHRISI
jgi:MFS family permease